MEVVAVPAPASGAPAVGAVKGAEPVAGLQVSHGETEMIFRTQQITSRMSIDPSIAVGPPRPCPAGLGWMASAHDQADDVEDVRPRPR
jgi:hypothetical protein